MIITPNDNGWSISEQPAIGEWHLVFDDKNIISFFQAEGITSTQLNLFVGKKTECDDFISINNLQIKFELPVDNLEPSIILEDDGTN
jgi:hypothetical protein